MEVIIMGNKLNVQEKTKKTYTKEMLIKNIAETSGKNVCIVRTIYNTLEQTNFAPNNYGNRNKLSNC